MMRAERNIFAGGFTLVEVITVVMIIGVLVVIVTPCYLFQVEKARVGLAKTDLQAMKVALEISAARAVNTYPELAEDARGVLRSFGLNSLTDPWGSSYYYGVKNQGREFIVYSQGPDLQPGGGDDIIATGLLNPREGQSVDTYGYALVQKLYVN
ncbi:MAG: type II secretion system protein GspG [Bacillota bacterium]